ncbi:MAG: phenylalanine--tRNA ligase subunit alpha [Anaerolineales bacterium]|nr:phenylalanine--tRNA ligase subunit alpha [Anaerolineales bacterium]
MQDKLEQIQKEALTALEPIDDEKALEKWQVKHLGRNSALMEVFKGLGSLSKEEKPLVGQEANQVKIALETASEEKENRLNQHKIYLALEEEQIDVTLPGRRTTSGSLHPTTHTLREIYRVFGDMGFQIYQSREVETDQYNFQLLNFPLHHPARDMQDTFFISSAEDRGDDPLLLRTHTSPGQIHYMQEHTQKYPQDPPPIRIILPGMCYRYEQITTRSEIQFNQVEGLAVGEGITFGDLKGTLSNFARRMFGQDVKTRFRASHFPFTEPSAEMDVGCFLCGGEGCSVCRGAGWLEILGCGMVHPTVLNNGGFDPEIYSGFAFGMGPERITMMRHRIEDIRYFWANDLRFIDQF